MEMNPDQKIPEGSILDINKYFGVDHMGHQYYRVIVPFSILEILNDEDRRIIDTYGRVREHPNQIIYRLKSSGYIEAIDIYELLITDYNLYGSLKLYKH
jgi:hypothetical protein